MLTPDERELLAAVHVYAAPVAMSVVARSIEPAGPDTWEGGARHDEWTRRHFELTRASIRLWQRELVRVIHPANGYRPDLVEVTAQGRAALDGTGDDEHQDQDQADEETSR